IQHLAEQNQPAEITAYITSVYDDLQSGTLQKLTGNQTLDVLLSDKLQAAQNHAVQFHIDYHPDVQLEQIAPPDLCILLGNLLDNALAAAAKSEQRQLVCQFRMKNEYYAVIHITNSCDIAPLMADGIPQTSQNDTQHGYGVQNAIRCAQKYGGDCQFHYDAEAKQFQVSVLLNIITR
ncbi:MAG: GHKL domain-containing protein, partial [Peptococcaceae bacterium]|nr:GHKL domain-containing protein [Peptococcaceae bacterium]